ncbi:MAG: MFS transporter [Actinomycetia bacterium]|nr:MFS transporter [Actinomycetes bacterium]
MGAATIDEIRPAIRHLGPRYYAPSVLATTGTMMLVPTLPLYLGEQTDSLTLVTVVLAAAAVGGVMGNIPSGMVVGRFGERAGFLGGILLSAIGTAGLALSSGVWLPFAACVVAGVGQASRMLARQSHARRVVGVGIRGRIMSLYGGLGRLAMLCGPLLGGFLGESIGFQATFGVAAGFIAAALVPALVVGAGTEGAPSPTERPERLGLAALLRTHGRIIGVAGLGQLGFSLVRVGRLTVIPLYGESIGLDLSDVGVIVAIAGGLDLVLFPVAGWIMDRFGRLNAILPSFLFMALGLFILPFADTFKGLAAAALLVGFGNGIGSGTMLTLTTDLAPARNPAEFISVLRILADSGRILGPLMVGVVADQIDLGASSVALGVVGLMTALLFAVAIGETRHGDF